MKNETDWILLIGVACLFAGLLISDYVGQQRKLDHWSPSKREVLKINDRLAHTPCMLETCSVEPTIYGSRVIDHKGNIYRVIYWRG